LDFARMMARPLNVTKVFFDISMSLDGYMTASGQTRDEPMSPGGDQLVAWAFGEDERDRRVVTDGVAGTGAVIAGRRTYDTSLPWWGAHGPTGDARVPVFVVSHDAPADAPGHPGGHAPAPACRQVAS
jgi:dihydrofolate reductase